MLLLTLLVGVQVSCGNSKKIQAPQNNSAIPFKEAFHKANSEKVIGHFESAITLFKKCIVLDPKSAASHFGLAQIYKSQKDSDKAVEYGMNAFNLDDNNKWYAEFLASVYFEAGNYHQSAKFYNLVIDKHQDRNIDNLSKLAQSYIFSNQKEEAIRTLNKMELEMGATPMTSLTKHDIYYELGKTKQADEALQNLFAENPLNANVALEAMDYFLQTRQYEKAQLAIDQVKKIDPENVFAKVGEAEVSLSKKEIDKTFVLLEASLPSEEIEEGQKISVLESLIAMGFDNRYPEAATINKKVNKLLQLLSNSNKNSANFMSLYGRFLMQNNKIDSAQIYFQEAVNLEPNSHDSWMNLMDASYNSGSYEKVVSDANKALTIFPNQPLIYLLKGISEYELNSFSKAEETLFTGQQIVIDDKELQNEFKYHLAKVKWQQNNKEKAASQFETLFETDPTNARFYYGYSQLLYSDGNKGKAFQYAKKAANIEPRIAEFSAFYAQLLMEEKNYELAKKMMESAIISDSMNSVYMERYGDIMFFLNDIDKAVEIWKEANKMKPSSRLEVKIKTRSHNE